MTKAKRRQRNPKKPMASPEAAKQDLLSRRFIIIVVALLVLSGGLSFLFLFVGSRNMPAAGGAGSAVAAFVGSETCSGCHQTEAKLWRGSQHRLAMDHATDKSVLGDFNDTSFDYYDVRSRFFRKDGKFLVETDGPDGNLATFQVKYTFGVDPLQQYLIEFPDGRLQALSIAWDSRPKAKGGQRWFHLYPNEEIRHDDVLHWTKLNQNWNFMCAECHSTGVRKNYDATNDRFTTTFAEISVGCETCHGQGSRHVDWVHKKQSWWPFGKTDDPSKGFVVRFDERNGVARTQNPRTGNPQRSILPAALRKEVETCGFCHARRSQMSEDWVPGRSLSETHAVSSVSRRVYYADGQIRDEEEPYNYTPFKQSEMFAAGVTCSDCHEPHSAKLRRSGDGVCLDCHSDNFASPAHHQHEKVSPRLTCISCHMLARTYMVVDPRHDHSFRVPRPDISEKLGTPNACNDCHADKSADWATSAIERWYGPNRKGFQNYGQAFQAAWTDKPDSEKLLIAVVTDKQVPSVARASALTELASHVSQSNIELAKAGLGDVDPMVRIGALDMLENVPARQIWTVVAPLLADPIQGVRTRAVSLLASVPTASQPPMDRGRFERAAAEFVAAQRLNADRPEARSALGSFLARRGFPADAEAEYKAALRLSPQFAPAAVNLADLYRGFGRDVDGEETLRAALAVSPQDAGLHHTLGLTLVRRQRNDEALAELRRAAELEPDRTRYAYVYGVALHSTGRVNDAIVVLKDSLGRHPNDRESLVAIITFSRDAGDISTAFEYAERLARMSPADRDIAALIESLRRQMKPPDAQ